MIRSIRSNDCGLCPFKKDCSGNKRRQSLIFSVYRRYHQLMQERIESNEGKSMKRRRMATVEPVFGSLLNYYGMKRTNAKGRQAAHKFMLNLLRTDVLRHPIASASGRYGLQSAKTPYSYTSSKKQGAKPSSSAIAYLLSYPLLRCATATPLLIYHKLFDPG